MRFSSNIEKESNILLSMQESSSQKFIEALTNYSIEGLIGIGKSDLHCHSGRGGSLEYLFAAIGKHLTPSAPKQFKSLANMQTWYHDNIKKHFSCKKGMRKRWESSFVRANEENIYVLVLSFTSEKINIAGGMTAFVEIVNELRQKYARNTVLLPELTFERTCNVDLEYEKLDEILEYNWFTSVDICSEEFAQPIEKFKKLFRKAKRNSLKLKAHVGEFGSADDVMKAVEVLELDEVHHGIAAARSASIMKWLARHQIQLNICPSSNIMLGIVDDYLNHPIKKIYDAGIAVTINTDNMLITNQTASQEYLNMFRCGLMTAEELNNIRLTGLNAYYG